MIKLMRDLKYAAIIILGTYIGMVGVTSVALGEFIPVPSWNAQIFVMFKNALKDDYIPKTYPELKDVLKNKNLNMKMLRLINDHVNSLTPYLSDEENYGTGEYFAKPSEMIATGYHDCEDAAIYKYALLRWMGVPKSHVKMIGVYVKSADGYHAVTIVSLANKWVILDLDTILPYNYADYEKLVWMDESRYGVY